MTSQQGNIRVCVRVRPLAAHEIVPEINATPQLRPGNLRPSRSVCVVDDRVINFDPSNPSKPAFQRGVPTHENRRNKDLRYVFQHAIADLLDGVLDGYNATVFAYGATGAGKTFTGTPENPGIMPLSMSDLFRRIEHCQDQKIIDISVSYLEVYNEMIRDLLAVDGSFNSLDLREDQIRVVVAGLSEHHPQTEHEVMALLQRGNLNRTKSATKANEDSSRSHAVFQIHIQQRDKLSGTSTQIKSATLTLCDLAGSERASATDHRGQLMREGANINKSLLALGNCINALCDENKRGQHIPYRDSKLTRLLKFSLGGNCRTVMIANISPAMIHFEETHNTLKYANRAKQIRIAVEQNVVNVDYHIGQYVELIESLKKEVDTLKRQGGNPVSSSDLQQAGTLAHNIFQLESASDKISEYLLVYDAIRSFLPKSMNDIQQGLVDQSSMMESIKSSFETKLQMIQIQLHTLKESNRRSEISDVLLDSQQASMRTARSQWRSQLQHTYTDIFTRIFALGSKNPSEASTWLTSFQLQVMDNVQELVDACNQLRVPAERCIPTPDSSRPISVDIDTADDASNTLNTDGAKAVGFPEKSKRKRLEQVFDDQENCLTTAQNQKDGTGSPNRHEQLKTTEMNRKPPKAADRRVSMLPRLVELAIVEDGQPLPSAPKVINRRKTLLPCPVSNTSNTLETAKTSTNVKSKKAMDKIRRTSFLPVSIQRLPVASQDRLSPLKRKLSGGPSSEAKTRRLQQPLDAPSCPQQVLGELADLARDLDLIDAALDESIVHEDISEGSTDVHDSQKEPMDETQYEILTMESKDALLSVTESATEMDTTPKPRRSRRLQVKDSFPSNANTTPTHCSLSQSATWSPGSVTPKARRPMLRDPQELKDYLDSHTVASPRVVPLPCSPAPRCLRRR